MTNTYSAVEAVIDLGPIVHADEDLGFIFCWNRSHTFNVLTEFNGRFQVVDCFQNFDVERNTSLRDVIDCCVSYCESLHEELNQEYA